ncbi:MAG TPA: TetR family transcriptional regulator [Ferruginibacter sp.]|nr:TetR family transcriptional regulator [Ferruginibacter sp.]
MPYNDKQLHILQTAEKLFAIRGYDGTSVRDIADKAGVNLAMISYYFGSKLKLMEALFEQRSLHIKMRVKDLLHDSRTLPIQKMEMLVDEYIDRIVEKQQFFKIMICEQVINKNPVIISLINELKLKNAEAITMIIKEGQKQGSFKKNIDVVLLMSTLVGTASQVMISLKYYREFNKLESITNKEFISLVTLKLRKHLKTIFKAFLLNE